MARNFLNPFRSEGLMGSGFADPFLSLHREVNRLFDDVMRGGALATSTDGVQSVNLIPPPMDVSETENEMVLKAELPGVSESDVEVTLNDDVLRIRAEKKMEHDEKRQDYHFTERAFGTFQRSLRLPFQAEPDQVNAHFENGVLTVRLRKAPAQDRSRKIQISSQGGKQGRIESGQSRAGKGESSTKAGAAPSS